MRLWTLLLPGEEGSSHRGARGSLTGHAGALGGRDAAGRRLVRVVAIQRRLGQPLPARLCHQLGDLTRKRDTELVTCGSLPSPRASLMAPLCRRGGGPITGGREHLGGPGTRCVHAGGTLGFSEAIFQHFSLDTSSFSLKIME